MPCDLYLTFHTQIFINDVSFMALIWRSFDLPATLRFGEIWHRLSRNALLIKDRKAIQTMTKYQYCGNFATSLFFSSGSE